MAKATFSSSVTYTPGGGGVLTQSFNVGASYSAIVAGRLDFPAGGAPAADIEIGFGTIGSALGVVLQNQTDVDVVINWNGVADAQYELAPGGVTMHWAPKTAAAMPLTTVKVNISNTPAVDGSIEYIVLGD